jgi:hypothetical protein
VNLCDQLPSGATLPELNPDPVAVCVSVDGFRQVTVCPAQARRRIAVSRVSACQIPVKTAREAGP